MSDPAAVNSARIKEMSGYLQSRDTSRNNITDAEIQTLKQLQQEIGSARAEESNLQGEQANAQANQDAATGEKSQIMGNIISISGKIKSLNGQLGSASKEQRPNIEAQIQAEQNNLQEEIEKLAQVDKELAEAVKIVLDLDTQINTQNELIAVLIEKMNEEKAKAENQKPADGTGGGGRNQGIGNGVPGVGQGGGFLPGAGGVPAGGVNPGAGFAGTGLNKPAFGSSYIESAKSLLRAVLALMVTGAGNNNPFCNIAKMLAGKSMVEVAKTLTEAGMTDEVVNGNPMLRHEALLVDTQAAGLRGIFETAIQYWNQTAQANKQIEKDTHQLAQRA